jgi:photosystem II stability/assembly factor-like uncharacterized protein
MKPSQFKTFCLAFLGVFWILGMSTRSVQAAPASDPYTWRNVEIVGGGFVSGIVFHPKQKDLLYIRTNVGGAFRWDAVAKRWIPLNYSLGPEEWSLYGIDSLALDPSDPSRVYLAAGSYLQSWDKNGSLLRSDDQGKTWKKTSLPFQLGANDIGHFAGERLAVDPNDGHILFLGSRKNGLWKSADRGETFTQVAGFPDFKNGNGVGAPVILFDGKAGNAGQATRLVYAVISTTEESVFRSKDAGATWEAIPGQPRGLFPIHMAMDSEGTLYFTYSNQAAFDSMTDGAVWKLDPQNDLWTDITPIKPAQAGGHPFGYAGLAVDVSQPGVVMVSTMDRWVPYDEIYRTTNGGKSWRGLESKAKHTAPTAPWIYMHQDQPQATNWMADLKIDPFNPERALYITGWGLWWCDDLGASDKDEATNWVFRDEGMEETAVLEVVCPPKGAALLSGVGDMDGMRHEDVTVSSSRGALTPNFNATNRMDYAGLKPECMVRVGYTCAWTARIHAGAYSIDGGKNWDLFTNLPSTDTGSSDPPEGGAVAISADGGTIVWAPKKKGFYYSQDRGDTWTACVGTPNSIWGENWEPHGSLTADRKNPKKFYLFDQATGKFYVSKDGGKKFIPTENHFSQGTGFLHSVWGRDGELWFGLPSGVYHSLDSGKTFVKIEGAVQVSFMGMGKGAPGAKGPSLYMAGKVEGVYGIYRSDDEAKTWVRINDDDHQFGSLSVITGDPRQWGRVYIGTMGRGILYGDPVTTVGNK